MIPTCTNHGKAVKYAPKTIHRPSSSSHRGSFRRRKSSTRKRNGRKRRSVRQQPSTTSKSNALGSVTASMKSLQDMESVAVQQRTTVSTTMSDVTSGMKDMEIVESVQHRADNIDDRGLSDFQASRHGNLANQSTLVKRTSAKGKRKHDDDLTSFKMRDVIASMETLQVVESAAVQQRTKRIKTIDFRLTVKFILCSDMEADDEPCKEADMKASDEFNKMFLHLKISHP